jgi:hypothetical protein
MVTQGLLIAVVLTVFLVVRRFDRFEGCWFVRFDGFVGFTPLEPRR